MSTKVWQPEQNRGFDIELPASKRDRRKTVLHTQFELEQPEVEMALFQDIVETVDVGDDLLA